MRQTILNSRRVRFVAQVFALLIFLGNGTPAFAQDKQPNAKVGKTAPVFILKDQNSKEVSLKKLLAQKPTALVFFRSADW